jgi:hypothetical protein
MSSVPRVLVSGLQERNANVMVGAAMMVGLGVLLDQFRRWQNGIEEERPFGVAVKAAVDRSGLLGWFMDANNALERLSFNSVGLGPLLGEPSRGQRPLQWASGAIGATGGSLDNIAGVLGIAGFGIVDDRRPEGAALRRVLPLNNAWWLDGLFDQVEGSR